MCVAACLCGRSLQLLRSPTGEDDGETRLGQGDSGRSADAGAATRDQADGAQDPPAPIEPPSSSSM
jgi:hypothetical protein